jgi:hypothetical protein
VALMHLVHKAMLVIQTPCFSLRYELNDADKRQGSNGSEALLPQSEVNDSTP